MFRRSVEGSDFQQASNTTTLSGKLFIHIDVCINIIKDIFIYTVF